MNTKARYIVFGIGILLGSLLLATTYIGKYNALKKQEGIDRLNGYKKATGIVPGQDLNAKKPFDTGPALFTQDSQRDLNGNFTRIIIAPGSGKTPKLIYRIEEIIWQDPNSTRQKLVRRRLMHADKIVVRLKKEDSNNLEQLKNTLNQFDMKLLNPGNGLRLYIINLPTHDIDTIPNAINTLASQAHIVEAALPWYIDFFTF